MKTGELLVCSFMCWSLKSLAGAGGSWLRLSCCGFTGVCPGGTSKIRLVPIPPAVHVQHKVKQPSDKRREAVLYLQPHRKLLNIKNKIQFSVPVRRWRSLSFPHSCHGLLAPAPCSSRQITAEIFQSYKEESYF